MHVPVESVQIVIYRLQEIGNRFDALTMLIHLESVKVFHCEGIPVDRANKLWSVPSAY